jgi:hypothetical protein
LDFDEIRRMRLSSHQLLFLRGSIGPGMLREKQYQTSLMKDQEKDAEEQIKRGVSSASELLSNVLTRTLLYFFSHTVLPCHLEIPSSEQNDTPQERS